jgi:hypothetical protein
MVLRFVILEFNEMEYCLTRIHFLSSEMVNDKKRAFTSIMNLLEFIFFDRRRLINEKLSKL